MVMLGGSGRTAGVILGAFLLIGLQDLFRGCESARMLFFGAAMVAMMIFRPQGLLPPRIRRYNASKYLGRFSTAIRRQYPYAEEEGSDA
mgnify:FL=1